MAIHKICIVAIRSDDHTVAKPFHFLDNEFIRVRACAEASGNAAGVHVKTRDLPLQRLRRFNGSEPVLFAVSIKKGMLFLMLGDQIIVTDDIELSVLRKCCQGFVIGLGIGKAVTLKVPVNDLLGKHR